MNIYNELRDKIPYQWRLPLTFYLLLLVVIFGLIYESINSMAEIWSRSDTFAHGYIILPIALYVVWVKKHLLAPLLPLCDTYHMLH